MNTPTTKPVLVAPLLPTYKDLKYRHFVDDSGNQWFVGDTPYAADHVWQADKRDTSGCGGRVCTFYLVDGKTISIQGPWHVTADHLFLATKQDVRNKHWRSCELLNYKTKELLFVDPMEAFSDKDAWKELRRRGQEFADQLKIDVTCSIRYDGRTESFLVKPCINTSIQQLTPSI
jgi:hypothetical protein